MSVTSIATLADPGPGIPKPNYVFYLGRPDEEEPHRSMERCTKLHEKFPEMHMVSFVETRKDADELEAKAEKGKHEVVLWEGDGKLMDWLMDHLHLVLGAQIVGPRWYKCPDGHLSAGTYTTLREKCEECSNGVAIVEPAADRIRRFAEVFGKVTKLSRFDTVSGEVLTTLVNPTKNLFKNVIYALGCPLHPAIQARDLRGAGRGKGALLCAAGPSLERALPDLKRLQDQYLILSVGRSYKLLRQHGIRVDYAVSVEMFDWDSAIFDDLGDVGETVLAFASVCAPATVQKWTGRRVCLWDIESARLMDRDDWIYGGNSVAHHMLNLAAQILECEPLILVGVDLAYTAPKSHAEGTSPASWPAEIVDKDAAYHAEELWVPCTGKGGVFYPACHRVLAPFGGGGFAIGGPMEVRSSPSYECFASLFSILISKHGKRTLNACPNGQKIDGAEYVDLGSL